MKQFKIHYQDMEGQHRSDIIDAADFKTAISQIKHPMAQFYGVIMINKDKRKL